MKKIFWIFIFLAAIPHFIFLNKFPVGINHDEAEVINSAIYFYKYKTDYSGVSFPLSLFSSKTDAKIASLPSFIISPFIGLLPKTVFYFRLIYVLTNIITILIFSKIIFELTKKKLLSQIIIFVSLLNPWFFIYSRATTEAPFALLFSLLGILFLINKKQNLILSLLFFNLSFFSYYGAKPIIPILGLLTYLFFYKHKKITKNLLFIFFLFLPLFITILSPKIFENSTSDNRKTELIFSKLDSFSKTTNEIRRTSIQNNFTNLFINKYYFFTKEIIYKSTSIFDLNTLFFSGDKMATYNTELHGLFYIIDFIFIILGIYFLKNKTYKKLTEFLLIIIICSPIAVILSAVETSIIFRGFLVPIFLITLISISIYNYKKFLLLISILYLIFYLHFLFIFFFINPIRQQENNFFSEQILSEYIKRENKNITIITATPYQIKLMFDLYQVNKNIEILNYCETNLTNQTLVIHNNIKCEFNFEKKFIQNQKDAGSIFTIYNNSLCDKNFLDNWKRNHKIDDYNLNHMSDTIFCNRWIQK